MKLPQWSFAKLIGHFVLVLSLAISLFAATSPASAQTLNTTTAWETVAVELDNIGDLPENALPSTDTDNNISTDDIPEGETEGEDDNAGGIDPNTVTDPDEITEKDETQISDDNAPGFDDEVSGLIDENPPTPAVTVDLRAAWDDSAPALSPAGHQLLANLVIAANDIDLGTSGTTNLTVVIDGVNAGFASWARGTTSNGGRTLTIPFNNLQLGTSERIGFGLIGDQQGNMGATVRVLAGGMEVARADLDPRPVLPGTQTWDLVASPNQLTSGTIQNQVVGLAIALTIDRTSPIPTGD